MSPDHPLPISRRCKWTRIGLVYIVLIQSVAAQADPAASHRTLSEVVEELNATRALIDDSTGQIAALEEAIEAGDREIALIGQRRHKATLQINAITAKIDLVQTTIRTWQDKLTKQAHRISWHVQMMKQLRSRNPVMYLLGEEDTQKIERMVRYHQHFAKSRAQAISDYNSMVKLIDSNTAILEEQRTFLADEEQLLALEAQRLAAERKNRQTLIARLRADLARVEHTNTRLQADHDRLGSLMQALPDTVPDVIREPPQLAQSELPQLPVADPPPEPANQPLVAVLRDAPEANEGVSIEVELERRVEPISDAEIPVAGNIVRTFGEPRADGRLASEGILIEAPADSAIRAIAKGEVIFADWFRGFGMMVLIKHSEADVSLYGYCDAILKQTGDMVERGDRIATVGNSGGQSTSGLYLEVRSDGKATDPVRWMRRSEDLN